ncbi:MAG: 8-amino-7-oxononanoate synthase [Pirellulales bacterium]
MTCRIDKPESSSDLQIVKDLPDVLTWIDDDLALLRQSGLERPQRIRHGKQAATVCLNGKTLINFGANDYLGYASDIRLTKAASRGSCAEGFGAGASPLVSGHSMAHTRLESAIANLLETDAALVFPSGFAANTAVIAALTGQEDFIASDARNHASIIDGCRMSRAHVGIYRHCNLSELDAMLASQHAARRRLIVTDSLFSMDGTIAPLPGLVELAQKHSAMLMVDEAHATGVFGEHGSGLIEKTRTHDGVHIRVGTLSKALGAAGGFVAGDVRLIHWLRHKARMWIFSTAHPPSVAAAATEAIKLISKEPERRHKVLERSTHLREKLHDHNIDIGFSESQIIPIIVGKPQKAVLLSKRLAEEGFFVPAIRPPSVPSGHSLLRISLSYLHDVQDIDRLVNVITHHVE